MGRSRMRWTDQFTAEIKQTVSSWIIFIVVVDDGDDDDNRHFWEEFRRLLSLKRFNLYSMFPAKAN